MGFATEIHIHITQPAHLGADTSLVPDFNDDSSLNSDKSLGLTTPREAATTP